MPDMGLALLRLDQIEARLSAKHPRAARDGHLVALLRSLRDEVQAVADTCNKKTEAGS